MTEETLNHSMNNTIHAHAFLIPEKIVNNISNMGDKFDFTSGLQDAVPAPTTSAKADSEVGL